MRIIVCEYCKQMFHYVEQLIKHFEGQHKGDKIIYSSYNTRIIDRKTHEKKFKRRYYEKESSKRTKITKVKDILKSRREKLCGEELLK